MTQGDPLSPTIFNAVVDAVVRHWLEGLQTANEEKGETGGGHFSAVFYADDRMVGASDPAWLQGVFSALEAIFDRVGLQKNVDKIVSVACHPCRAGSGNRTTEGYRRRMTGDGNSFRERQRERVACSECGAELAAGSLSSHFMTRHGKAAPRRHLWAPQTTGGAQDIQNEFPEGRQTTVPGGGMPGGVRDTSGDAGALRAPARPRHRGHI